jgi:tetratricopeptide (TPR) repeat protein
MEARVEDNENDRHNTLNIPKLLVDHSNKNNIELEILTEAIKKYDAKDYYGAIEDFTKAIKLYNLFYAEVCYNRGVARFKLADYKGALVDYDETLKENPNFINALINRGIVNLNSEREKAGVRIL